VPSARHSSESWNPVPLQIFKSLDSSFRWNDVVFRFPARTAKNFPGQQCAKAGMTAMSYENNTKRSPDLLQSCSHRRANPKLAPMSASFCLHRFTTSRLLRVVAMFAWLLMAISLPAVSAHTMAGEGNNAAAMASMMADHDMHADATDGHHADQCCGNTTHATCHCDAMCGAALLPGVPALHGPARLAALPIPLRGMAAPTLQFTPPLRPPAV
jgi:hypothetical protein